jgi:hypothetical protein
MRAKTSKTEDIMPLLPGNDHTVIAHNVREMLQAGHPEKVAVAAALANADKHGLGEKQLKLKRPHLHRDHPFNSKAAPSNRARPAPSSITHTPAAMNNTPVVMAR